MKEPTVSVVMASYNEEKFIEQAIESLLNQSYSSFEFIIVDDGSDDGTRNIIKSFDDCRIRMIVNESNKGLPASLNRGIQAATGTYIARMDADDRSLPKRLEKQVNVLNNQPDTQVVGCWINVIDGTGSKIGTVEYEELDGDPKVVKDKGPGIAHPSAMFRKSIFDQVGGYREEFTYAQDLDLWVRIARMSDGGFIQIIPEILFERRVTPETFSNKPLKNEFGKYAGAVSSETFSLDEIESEVTELPLEMRDFIFNYNSGRWSLRDGYRKKSLCHFVKAIKYRPYSIRAWYGLFLWFLPQVVRKHLTQMT